MTYADELDDIASWPNSKTGDRLEATRKEQRDNLRKAVPNLWLALNLIEHGHKGLSVSIVRNPDYPTSILTK